MAAKNVIRRNANVASINSGISEETLFFAGTEENEDFVMDISAENTSAILNELTDLSSNPGAYAIREAYSNAYDAVVATGDMGRTIEVRVPMTGEFNEESLAYKLRISECPLDLIRYATVTDRGIGMTSDDLRRFFTQYGGTKKQGAGLIGSKGLGSKAPLACADFFDVITVKDGIRSVAHLWRGNGHNYAKIVKVEPTDEPSGTTVRIPVVDPKVAAEMHECMSEIAKWNLDANLTYNGERYESFLNEGVDEDGKEGYVFLGNVVIGENEDGEDVRVRMWQRVGSFPNRLYGASSYFGNGYHWSLTVDLNLCGVRYPLTGSGRRGTDETPDLIVAGDPGYLNFTPSRDEVKDDDAKKAFLTAVSEAQYDPDAVIGSMLAGKGYGAVARNLLEHSGYVLDDGMTNSLVFSNEVIDGADADRITDFDGTDMGDYIVVRGSRNVTPASGTLYRSITKLSGSGYIAPNGTIFREGVAHLGEGAYYGVGNQPFTAREVARVLYDSTPMPLVAIVPSPVLASADRSRGYGATGCRSILNRGDNHVIVISGDAPDWDDFRRRESSVRKLVASRTGQDMKRMAATYLFPVGGEPSDSDLMAIEVFANVTRTTWAELVADIRKMNRVSGASRKAAAKQAASVGSRFTTAYELTERRIARDITVPYEDALDALLGDDPQSTRIEIDFDTDDLSRYVFAIGDGGDSVAVAHIASAMAMAGLLGDAKTLCFLGTTASATTSYPLNVNEIKALAKSRGLRIFADLRASGAHIDGIVDGYDGISIKADGGYGSYHVTSKVSLEALGITGSDVRRLAYVLRQDRDFRYISSFVLNCRDILGSTFCELLDDVLASHDEAWWTRREVRTYRYCANHSTITAPEAWTDDLDAINATIKVFKDISCISGVQALISEASNEDGALAKSLITSGLESIVRGRVAA